MTVTSNWWNSSVAQTFKRQVSALNAAGSQLRSGEWDFVSNISDLIRANDDFADMRIEEWQPSAKQINYVQALHRNYCVEPLDR